MDKIRPNDEERASFPIKVILVENDDNVIVSFLKRFGTRLNIKVIESAEECLVFIRNTYPPDAIIIDRNMGGVKFLETVRQENWTHTLPVVITTDQITQDLIKEIVARNGDDLFSKSFSQGDLVTRLEYFIKRRHYQSAKQARSNVLAVKIPF